MNLKELEDYINMYAWNYGRFYHAGDAEKIKEKVAERMDLPHEFLEKFFKEEINNNPMTEQELKIFSPNTPDNLIPVVVKWFNQYASKYEVNTPIRIAAFIAQLIHESNAFKAVREYASGSAYEGREDLGNVFPGDGKKYKGRGYIQITGRNNYAAVSRFIFGDLTLIDNPELLATPQYAMLSAFWFWHSRNLNALADINYLKTVTRRINGGLNGLEDRLKNYNRICDYYHLPHWSA